MLTDCVMAGIYGPMDSDKATRIGLFSFAAPQMRTFHMTWIAFFTCFFGWFGIAPLMVVIRDEFALTKAQVFDTIIASVAVTVLARLAIGWLCDKYGPRRTYAWLLILGAIPVAGIGLSTGFVSFLVFRLMIGVIGASFVITQYHTSQMFAPNCVGAANATTAGWGNLGGGVTQAVMPLLFGAFMFFTGDDAAISWRLAMLVPAAVLLVLGVAYYRLTKDTPEGDLRELRAKGKLDKDHGSIKSFFEACKDYRVWALFAVYAACFGIELTINNIAALYFKDEFGLSLKTAGLIAASFGLMNIFARSLGGIVSDKFNLRWGLRGRVMFLATVLAAEGIGLMIFSRMVSLPLAVVSLIAFSLFVQASEGATFAIVPFVKKRALGSVAGIVGAGGNVGAVAAGFVLRSEGLTIRDGLFYIGAAVAATALVASAVRFSAKDESEAREEMDRRLAAAGH